MLNRLHDTLRLRTNPAIFFSSAAVIVIFVLGTIIFTDALDSAVSVASDWLLTNLGWFYILGVTVFLGFLRSEEHTSELQSRFDLVCRLLLEKKKKIY